MVCLNFSEFYTSYQPKQFIRFDLAIIKLKLPFLIGHDSKEDKPNPICLDFTMNDSHEFGEDFWWMKTLTMVGFLLVSCLAAWLEQRYMNSLFSFQSICWNPFVKLLTHINQRFLRFALLTRARTRTYLSRQSCTQVGPVCVLKMFWTTKSHYFHQKISLSYGNFK